MEGRTEGGLVVLDAPARERFYDSRGYGRPRGDGLALAPVEAAHLLSRGDLESVDGREFAAYLAAESGLSTGFLVYADLRDRGFYLSPAREGWVDDPAGADLVVFPRGSGPWDDDVAYRVRVVPEHATVEAASLGDVVLAVVDEDSELTYLETDRPDVGGCAPTALDHSAEATLLDDRAVVRSQPPGLYSEGFYGQPLSDGADAPLQLSLVEAAYLAHQGDLSIEGGPAAVRAAGREAEGDRFDRRLAVYADLRDRGVVPKTGFKFGTDFRTYAHVESAEEVGHSERLVRVLPEGHAFAPRDLSLDVRLAHGVRKRMTLAFTDGEAVEWLSVGRLTP